MSYKNILVALDKSEESDYIFEEALKIATQEKSRLKIFHCVPLENGTGTTLTNLYGQELINFSLSNYLEEEMKIVEKWLKKYEIKAKNKGIESEIIWKIGEPSSLIRDMANSWPADLIIIGRRGLSGLSEFFLGSVSNHIIHHVKCSVLVVQKTAINSP